MSTRILVTDDEKEMRDLLQAGLGAAGFDVVTAASGAEALEILGSSDVDVVLTDVRMKGMTGLELCAEVQRRRPDLPVVVLTAFGSLEAAIEAIRAGAWDFIAKPVDLDALEVVVRRAVEHRQLSREVRRLQERPSTPRAFSRILGDSPPMRRVFDLLPRAARAEVSVLITGETGTGKELVARALHEQSMRGKGPFLAINCSALPETLLESELFGHTRGAFTDARTARDGLFVQAHGGTLFLDEVGDMPLALQPKLLRVLQERKVRPLGAAREVEVDCRILAATNRDLKADAEEGRFRKDLYYRLCVIEVRLPPLRLRAGDILTLAQHFLERAATRSGRPVSGMTTPVARALLAWPWPGNVRELENCIERAVALTDHDHLVLEDLPEEIRQWRDVPERDVADQALLPLDEVERRHVFRALDAAGGNKTLAAQMLGVDRRTLYRKLERWAAGESDVQDEG